MSPEIHRRGLLQTGARYLLIIVALAACEAASDPTPVDIGTSGPSFADITLDGEAWTPETRSYFRNADYLSIGFDRYVPGTPYREGIGFFLRNFTGEGSYALRGPDSTSSAGYGSVDTSAGTGGGIGTVDTDPGLLRVTGFDPTDSTVAGTFRFVLHLDGSAPARTISFEGSFRVRPSEQLP